MILVYGILLYNAMVFSVPIPSHLPLCKSTLYKKDRCCDGHVTVSVAVLTAVTQSDNSPPKPHRPVIICMAWSHSRLAAF
jgi:hypothetical protein